MLEVRLTINRPVGGTRTQEWDAAGTRKQMKNCTTGKIDILEVEH